MAEAFGGAGAERLSGAGPYLLLISCAAHDQVGGESQDFSARL
jgi:hypothetical protein